MVKAKKGRSAAKDDDIDDDDFEIEGVTTRDSKGRSNEENTIKKKGKKGKRDEDSESEDDEYTSKKKNKKSSKAVDLDEDEHTTKKNKKTDDGGEEEILKPNKKKSKKDKKKFDEEDEEDDEHSNRHKKKSGKNTYYSDEEDEHPMKGKNKVKSKKKQIDNDNDSDDEISDLAKKMESVEISKGKKKKKGKKNRDDFDDDYGEESDEENVKPAKGKSKSKNAADSEDDNDEEAIEKPKAAEDKGGKKGKKARKKRDDDDEDIEKALAELELEYAGLKPKEDETKKSAEPEEKIACKGKKGKKEKDDSQAKDDDDDDISRKKKGKSKKKDDEIEVKSSAKDDDDDKKGKKDKKKKDERESKKGPGKKMLAAMQEALKKIKEEEERLQREEEERIRKAEEAEAARLEALRIEKEKKEKKKQKEKERKERLKAEGKLLTAKQKADKLRAQEMISALRAQGLELPDPGEKKPRPGTRIRPNKAKQVAQQEKESAEAKEKENSIPPPEQVQVEIVDTKAETKEESEDEVKDNWDSDTSEAEEEDVSEKIDEKKTEHVPPAKVSEDSESEEEEEEEDEEEDSSEGESGSEDEHKTDAEKRKEKALARIEKRREEAEKNRSLDNLRAAVVCVLGHVDTGKTKILDKLRRTHVQDGEAGGITQQIGATNVPIDNIKETCKLVKGFADLELKIPGLLIIDTPGHESFSNLRSRGSSLCDIAILVVDIMHGLEPQTIESINLLKSRKTPFIVALNKIDRLYNWKTGGKKDIRDILKSQADNTQLEFKQRTQEVTVQFAEQGLNAALFYDNPDIRSYVSLVPTSAISGEGMGNLLALIVELCQTMLAKRLMYSEQLLATVLEVKAVPGLGTTIDAILINGKLKEGDTMILAGTDGPIVTQIRSLLMPQPMKELRVKTAYVEYKEIKAAQGVKIAAKDLEKAIAGLNLQIAEKPDEVPIFCDEVSKELKNALSSIKLKERGVYVQASTLGSLEALLEFLRTSKIPYSGIRIGPVVKKDVMKASIMLEHDSQYATILAFDVKIERDAQELADSLGVKIFQADIIYHLFDKFMAYREELKQKKRDEFKNIAVFPCKLRILPKFVFNTRDPIVVGVMVEAGIVKEGTPLCVPSKEFINVGIVTSVEVNHKALPSARKGMEVCVKIENTPGETPKLYGRHFDHTDMLISKISRQSIDACKDYFRDDLTKHDWQLMVELKRLFQIL